jgi:hypothetical protein
MQRVPSNSSGGNAHFKVLAICLALSLLCSAPTVPGNRNAPPMLRDTLLQVSRIAKANGQTEVAER